MLSRFISTHLARHGVAALFVQMAYYGPRRPAGSKLRLMSTNIPMTTEAVTQTVLDLRGRRCMAGLAAGDRPQAAGNKRDEPW